MRFGDPAYNAGTLRHLHVHIQVPDGQGPAFTMFNKFNSFKQLDTKIQQALVLDAFTQK